MARLSARERAALPDRAFAYIDSTGRRRLPIYDAVHVRNALARFDQVRFESDAARERARRRLLAAARRFRIVPIGFIDREIRSAREQGERDRRGERALPTGFLSLLMTDIEGSTPLLAVLGDAYADVLDAVRTIHGEAIGSAGGVVVEARADEHFAVFATPEAAVRAAIGIQAGLADRSWPVVDAVGVRIGIHAGYPTRRGSNYVGMPVHVAARVCEAAHGGQIVVSGDLALALGGRLPDDLIGDGLGVVDLGAHRLRGIPGDPMRLHQIVARGLTASFPPLRVGAAQVVGSSRGERGRPR